MVSKRPVAQVWELHSKSLFCYLRLYGAVYKRYNAIINRSICFVVLLLILGFFYALPVFSSSLPSSIHTEPTRNNELLSRFGWWDFSGDTDKFNPASLLDLSYLNENTAGETGWIRRSKEGDSFVRGNGEPIRFWALGSSLHDATLKELRQHAKFIAKRGVNMVRWHGALNPKGEHSELNNVDEGALDSLFKLIAAMKSEGIYVTVSPYYANTVRRKGYGAAIGKNWPVPRNPAAKNLSGLLFFDPTLQDAYRNWLKELFNRVNPYTGIPLRDEPALAIFQIQNEDSLLFWTFDGIRGEDLELLRSRYGKWLQDKYGALDVVQKKWRNALPLGSTVPDDWQAQTLSFFSAWQLTRSDLNDNEKVRVSDQLAFISDLQRNFNSEIVKFLREEIKTRVLVNPGNWKTVNARLLEDLERYTYTAGDVIAVNKYVGANHQGKNSGWAISTGQQYQDISVLKHPELMPLSLKQIKGFPYIVSESLWTPPMSYQAEGPFLVSNMQSLNGVDIVYWFTASLPQWEQPASANGFFPSVRKWTTQTPMIFGQFPAAALSFRNGYVDSANTVLHEVRYLDDLYQRAPAKIHETSGLDPNRRSALLHFFTKNNESVSNRVFLAGPVTLEYVEKQRQEKDGVSHPLVQRSFADSKLLKRINSSDTIVAKNGQILWDIEQGHSVIDSKYAQGSCGFFGGKAVAMSYITLHIDNDYACIWFVSLDGLAIHLSKRILLQIGTRQYPSGWKTLSSSWKDSKGKWVYGEKIEQHGVAPWKIEQLVGKFAISNPNIKTLMLLDENGEVVEKQSLSSNVKTSDLHGGRLQKIKNKVSAPFSAPVWHPLPQKNLYAILSY